MRFWIILLGLISSPLLRAEYRLYQYQLIPREGVGQGEEPSLIRSALHPQAFYAYHSGAQYEITLLRSWICPGYTGALRPPCLSPYEKIQQIESAP